MSTRLIDVSLVKSPPRGQLKLWPLVTFPLSALAAWAINAGGEALRWVGLGAIFWSLAVPLLVSLEAGLFAMMLFEPLRGFLRRAQYLFLPYSQTDPIHIVTPLVTMLALAMVLQRCGLRMFRATPLAGLVSILGSIYFLEMFNPLQGGLSVGLSGALFMLVPVVWFYFGQTVKPAFMETALRLIVVLGILTSLYGLYQLAFGFPAFEQFWIEHTEFYNSIQVGNVKRALATYSSAEEWGRYIEIGALIAFGFGACARRFSQRAGWFGCGSALSLMLLFTGQRTAIFGLIFGVFILLMLGVRTWRAAATRILLALTPVVLIAVFVQAPTNDDMLSHDSDDKMAAVLSHTARGTLRPNEEASLQERLKNWSSLATEYIPFHPLGIGLGGTSVGAWRFNTELDLPPIDSYFISTVITCGLPTALLFLWIVGRATRMSWRGFRRAEARSRELEEHDVVVRDVGAKLNEFRVQASACVDLTESNVRFNRSSNSGRDIGSPDTGSEIEWREIETADTQPSHVEWSGAVARPSGRACTPNAPDIGSWDGGVEDRELEEAAWREARVWRIAATLMPVLILNSMFGNTFTLYSVAPIGWLLVGWISAATLRHSSEQAAP